MAEKLTHELALKHAIEAVKAHFENDEKLDQILHHLQNSKNFESYAIVMGSSWQKVRSITWSCFLSEDRGDLDLQTLMKSMKKIEKISDNLHNVSAYVVTGVPCDPVHLLRNGVDSHWPTGIVNQHP